MGKVTKVTRFSKTILLFLHTIPLQKNKLEKLVTFRHSNTNNNTCVGQGGGGSDANILHWGPFSRFRSLQGPLLAGAGFLSLDM
jgi:hypothetical protein